MSHMPKQMALQALADWWQDMGVETDPGVIKAFAKHMQPSSASSTALVSDAYTDKKDVEAVPLRKAGPAPTQLTIGTRRSGGSKSSAEWVEAAQSLAAQANTLEALKAAIEGFDGCPLKAGAQNTVVYDGVLQAPIMVIGEGAGGTEDQIGLPFVGKAGQLLDKMLAAIACSRKTNTFITNVTYWRPPGNRNPEADELSVCRPFVDRMIELNAPKLIIATGGVAAKSLLQTKTGIMRLRGQWADYTTPSGFSCPLMPIFHPAYLLRRPQDKSRSWRDLLAIQARFHALDTDA